MCQNRTFQSLEQHSYEDLLKQIGQINSSKINANFRTPVKAVATSKIRFFYGAASHNTWPKLFVLTKDGKFYCEYLNHMNAAQVIEKFDFDTFNSANYKWGGYQSIVEIDEETAKSKVLRRQANWVSRYLNSLTK